MPISEEEIEIRLKQLESVIKNKGSSFIMIDDKSLEETIKELKEENKELKSKLEQQPKEIDLSDFIKKEEFAKLQKDFSDLQEKLENMKVGGNDIDLTKEFKDPVIFSLKGTDLKLDKIMPPITGEILNQALKTPAVDPKRPVGVLENYPFPKGLIIPDKIPAPTMKDWIDPNSSTSQFQMGGGIVIDNSFDTANPVEDGKVEKGAAVKSAPTGGGKSTTFLRCLAFRGLSNEEVDALSPEEKEKLGASLVVPEKSLVDSALDGHNDWLSDEATALEKIAKMKQKIAARERKEDGTLYTEEEDVDYRVIKCPFCNKKHTAVDGKPYETVKNGFTNMINVFFWADFLHAYVNNPSIIKPWVVFDEAHLKIPVIYRTLITCLIGEVQ